jgi:hypothetical protein
MVAEDDDVPESAISGVCFVSEVPATHSVIPLVPGLRGSFGCYCRGTVLTMLSHYGWVWPFEPIDHPLMRKHSGRIYVQKCDILGGNMPSAGDIVSFYLYADNVGLGAEACCLEESASTNLCMHGMRAEAKEFVPQARGDDSISGASSRNELEHISDIYARMSRAFASVPANGYVQMSNVASPCIDFTAMNSAYFEEDDSIDGGDDGDKESLHDDSDSSSVEGSDITSKASQLSSVALSITGLSFGGAWKVQHCAELSEKAHHAASTDSDDASTAAGLTSDSDWDTSMRMKVRPPPGFEKPPEGFFPPPGLPPPGTWA